MAGIDSTDRRQRRVPRAAGSGMNHPLRRAETIDVTDAVLGTTRTFPSLDGKLKVKIPADKQPDEIFRLNGKGLPRFRGSGRGDINFLIQVHVPEEVSKKKSVSSMNSSESFIEPLVFGVEPFQAILSTWMNGAKANRGNQDALRLE